MSHRPDSEIAAAVSARLARDPLVPYPGIRATVSQGVVTLFGDVDYTSQRLEAARAISELEGVRDVLNEIIVRQPKVAPHAIRAAIHDALERQVEREARELQIDIVDGRITITGTVHSAAEHRAIIGAVTGTHGVEQVIDQLHVVP